MAAMETAALETAAMETAAETDTVRAGDVTVTLRAEADAAALAAAVRRGGAVRIAFSAMGDGRGFSLARRLRAMGFAGELRAAGPLIPDQFGALARVGFDTVEHADGCATALGRGRARMTGYRERLLRR